jgi:hypothetical protein
MEVGGATSSQPARAGWKSPQTSAPDRLRRHGRHFGVGREPLGGSFHPGRASGRRAAGFGLRRPSGFGLAAGGAELEVVPRRGTKPMEDGASLRLATAARRPDSSAEQRLEGGCLPGMVARGSGNGTARLRPRHGKKGAWRSASADSSPPRRPGSADSCSSQRRASAVRVLRGPHERWNVTGATAVVTPSGCWRGNLRGV